MRRLRNFLRLPWREKAGVLQALVVLWTIRFALAVLPYRIVEQTSRALGRRLPLLPALSTDQVSWCVRAASGPLPSTRPCLPLALTARLLLAWYGHESELCLGVRRENGELQAHAWLMCNGEVCVGGGPGPNVPLHNPMRESR